MSSFNMFQRLLHTCDTYIHNTQKVDRCTNIHIVIDKLPHKAAVITSIFTHFPIAGLHSPRFDSDIAPCFELVTPTNLKKTCIKMRHAENVCWHKTQQKSTSQKTSENPCFPKKHVFPFDGFFIVSACSSWCFWRKLCSS